MYLSDLAVPDSSSLSTNYWELLPSNPAAVEGIQLPALLSTSYLLMYSVNSPIRRGAKVMHADYRHITVVPTESSLPPYSTYSYRASY